MITYINQCCWYTFKNGLENVIIREEHDLGITFMDNYKFSKHINLSIHKANKILGIIYQSFQTLNSHCISYVIC